MINLAGRDDADREIKFELDRARITVVERDLRHQEVSAGLGGQLRAVAAAGAGEWAFRRAWYYWVACADEGRGLPIELARLLYADPVGKIDVRVGGHCACPPPDKYGATYLDAEGRPLVRESERATFENFIQNGILKPEVLNGKAFTADPKADYHHATIDSYHIDSEVGLRLFADVLRTGQVAG